MKREALNHPKMLHFASLLGIPKEHAIGIITVLLNWTADMAPQGDVGKWPDGAIAMACGWSGSAPEFVAALTESKWLDKGRTARLLVHDWPDHCERFVKSKLASLGITFHADYSDTSEDTSRDTSTDISADAPYACAGASAHDQTKPTPPKPNQSKPKSDAPSPPPPKKTLFESLPIPPELDNPDARSALRRWETHRKQIKKPLTEEQAKTQLAQLAIRGSPGAIAMIDHTIFKGWQGLREPEENTQQGPKRNPHFKVRQL